MPTPVEWFDEEHTIVKVTIQANSTWQEYFQVIDWIVAEVPKVDHRVEIIFHDEVGLPKGGNPIRHLKWGSEKIISLPNTGHVFIAGSQGVSSTFLRMIFAVLQRIYSAAYERTASENRRLFFVDDLETALKQIEAERNPSPPTIG